MEQKRKIIFVVPFTLLKRVYPWGVHVLKHVIDRDFHEVEAYIWDLRTENGLNAIFDLYRDSVSDDVSKILNQIARATKGRILYEAPFSEETQHHYMTAALAQGRELLDTARKAGMRISSRLEMKLGDHLENLQIQLRDFFSRRVKNLVPSDCSVVWGVTTYQHCLFPNLFIGSILADMHKKSSVLIGGDPIDMETGIEIIKKLSWVDGAVLGEGERVLAQIMEQLCNGDLIQDMELPRLINRRFLSSSEDHEEAWKKNLKERNDYEFVADYPGVEWDENTRTIHILGRRGCAWGKCTFCHRMHVASYLSSKYQDPHIEATFKALTRILSNIASHDKSNGPIEVSFDSDDNAIEDVAAVLKWLSDHLPKGIPAVKIWAYARSNLISREKMHYLSFLGKLENLDITFSIPIETLNADTLKNMKKGGNILLNIKAMKFCLDIGLSMGGSFYFIYYPLENYETVQEENFFLNNTFHLLTPPKTEYGLTIYLGSTRDYIGRNEETFGIKLNKSKEFWMKHVLNLDLPETNTCSYDVVAKDRKTKAINSYVKLCRVYGRLIYGEKSTSATVSALSSGLVFLLHQVAAGNLAYVNRIRILFAMRNWTKNYLDNNHPNAAVPAFYLKENKLVRKYPKPFFEEWTIELSPMEIDVLRYLYHPRSRSQIDRRFNGSVTKDSLNGILNRHRHLKSILKHGNQYVSVFNDPEYFTQQTIYRH